jgi:AcrR family transcriptional regulator
MPTRVVSQNRRKAPRPPRRGGRPTSEQTAQLSGKLREAALDLFLENGYEGTTLEAIARAAGTTKPSLYARFQDKETLFVEVVRWTTGRSDWPVPEPTPSNPEDLEGALRDIADAALRRATHPSTVKLTRLAVAQAARFPELAVRANAAGWPRKQQVIDLLERHSAKGDIVADEPEILAEHFFALVSGMPARLASFGIVRDSALQRRYNEVAVDLFLRGLRPPS